ncbi:sensor histidine kinase [Arthrobacter sp. UM1]|uniref:sensor histidine kinase n=1 Tax=Arthrobacter sp. UM1 TaxID=2766776 RepID=UPI001CF66277|nr:histidine kinase [Arthrobacter sp. UM1]MCB4208803.1 hypothetical protein [Arthrobacter sp. UM1]
MGVAIAAGLLFAPVSVAFLLLASVTVAGLALAPLLIRWDSISIFDWVVRSDGEAYLLCFLSIAAAAGFLYAATGLALVQVGFYRSLTVSRLEDAEAEALELRASRDLLLDAFDTERRRIEGMLHDGVQHRLVALAMSLGLAETNAENETVRQMLSHAHRQADEALAELRQTIRGILPRALTERGLTPAVQDLIADFPGDVCVDLPTSSRLPRRVEQVSYFVVSEALANVMKHAEASRTEVVGEVKGGEWLLRIDDDGVGGARSRPGGGLEGLKLRASALGGSLRIGPRQGGGTSVVMSCPLEASSPREVAVHEFDSDVPRGGMD